MIAGNAYQLPVGSVVLDRDGWPLWRYREQSGGWCAANGARDIKWPEMERDGAPFTVIHIPGHNLLAEAWLEGYEWSDSYVSGDDEPRSAWDNPYLEAE